MKARVALSRSVGLCPTGLDACSVPGSLDYEVSRALHSTPGRRS